MHWTFGTLVVFGTAIKRLIEEEKNEVKARIQKYEEEDTKNRNIKKNYAL